MAPVLNLISPVSNLKILIRLPNWLGDVVMSTAFINAVVQLYPGAVVDVIIKKELGNIASLIPGINQAHLFSKQDYGGLTGVYRFGKGFSSKQYDIFFNLPHSLSSFVLAWASGAKQRVGFSKEGGFFMMSHSYKKPAGLHRVDEYLYLLEQFTGKSVANRQVRLDAGQQTSPKTNTVVVNFNSEASSRRMPLDKGRSIINTLTHTFKDVTFAFVGAPGEAAFVDELITGLQNGNRLQNHAGKTNLAGLAQLMAGSKAVLTTDSGPAHLANAVGTPVTVLFGAGNETNTAPYNKGNLNVLRYGQLSCEPCLRNKCELYGIPKCMEMLDEIKIINALSLHLNDA